MSTGDAKDFTFTKGQTYTFLYGYSLVSKSYVEFGTN